MALSTHRRLHSFLLMCCSSFKRSGLRQFSKVAGEKPPRQMPREKPALRRRNPGGGGYPLLIIPLTTFGLGTWQIQRRQWKLNLIQELEDKMLAPPVPLPENLDDLKQMEYRRVVVKGTFDHSKELFIGPRTNTNEPETMGSARATSVGVHVVTPFKLSDRNETILVNRGHVPFVARPPELRREGQVEGEVELVGVVRLSERKNLFGNDPLKDGYWLSRDVEDMADIAETAPVFIDADLKSTVKGGPHGGQTRVQLRNEHLTYIITWYVLTILTLWVWFRNYRSVKPHASVVDFIKREHRKL
ncbi:surf1-like protein [Plakobranchus ocellatus]|uniref:SURF1-like protein n=1 Tax=Plakobranchus ocellatus TaxID=259542 RepID=A0AAV4DZB3_9GAST|nr:surf1-like protein [Plakobranchus ocellatus]